MPVTISRSGKCPWRTNRARPSAVSLSAWVPRKPATSASTACANSARAPLRKISVNGSLKVPGCASLRMRELEVKQRKQQQQVLKRCAGVEGEK
jgi:hypothetical protein